MDLPSVRFRVSGRMIGWTTMRRTPLTAILVACAAGAAGGCTRTSDGSVVMTYSPSLPHFLYRDRPEETVSPRERMASLDHFPAAPGGDKALRRRKPPPQKLRAWKVRTIETPFNSSASDRALRCHNESSPDGRIRVVCD
jgi:hypothetical protein